MSRCSLVYVPSIETGRHVKNNACAVEIKIKWMKRKQKQMTHENTYRDDMSCCMQMPVGTQQGIATWSPAGIQYMQYARYGKNSFRFAASTLWNSLPDHFRTENSFSKFKSFAVLEWVQMSLFCMQMINILLLVCLYFFSY